MKTDNLNLLPDTVLCGPACQSAKLPAHIHASLLQQVVQFVTNLFDTSSWPPRWHCGTWSDFHGWLYIVSDLGIWAAYFAIPMLLFMMLKKRKDLPFNKVFVLFIAFILLCGLTHLIDAIIFWWPAYRVSALLRFATAVVSGFTVYALYKILPVVFTLRSIGELEAEMQKRRNVEEKLAAREFMLSEAGRISRVGGWEADVKTKNLTWTDTIYEIYELPADTDINSIDPTTYFLEPYRQKLLDSINNACANGQRWDLELVLVTAGQKTIWVRCMGEPMYDKNGELIKLRGVFMDIDRYKCNEIALNKSLELTIQNNQHLKNFTHILSHNIRNHTSNIALLTSLIDMPVLDEENADLINKMKIVSGDLSSTLDDLSEAIKIRENVVEAEEVDFNEIADKSLTIMQSALDVHHAVVTKRFEVKNVYFPRIYLESIILNLVSNAVKYARPSVPPVIELSTYKDEGYCTVFECRDNGLGIDLGLHSAKIFGLYKTFHSKKDSRGVGLFLVKTQIESQGGRILVESTPGKGSVFKIIFNEKD